MLPIEEAEDAPLWRTDGCSANRRTGGMRDSSGGMDSSPL